MLAAVEISAFRSLVNHEIQDYITRYPVLHFAGAFESEGVLWSPTGG
jgi:predicted house-cleaning NTP pyrophosphatase (Maf/HAM1 superfamily)